MQDKDEKTFYYQASASPLGGQVQKPFCGPLPSPASSALPAAGGFASSRSEAFNHENIVSFTAAYTRISRHKAPEGGEFSTLVTTVVEGLNILEIVTAKRVVAQLSVTHPREDGARRISVAGSRFEGLSVAGYDAKLTYEQPLRWSTRSLLDIYTIGGEQGKALTGDLLPRYKWTTDPHEEGSPWPELAMCSLLSSVGFGESLKGQGHVISIPDFGRIFLGELLVTHTSAQLTMVRAELGCNVHATISASVAGGGGTTMPPGKYL